MAVKLWLIDGDSPSAQRLGTRFNASGYPTMILFTPEGRGITRLPGEVDADQYMRKGGNHNEVLQRLAAQMGSVCAKLPAGDPARATCGAVLRARPSTAA